MYSYRISYLKLEGIYAVFYYFAPLAGLISMIFPLYFYENKFES